MADDQLDSLARLVSKIAAIRYEKKCYERKQWIKEAFANVPLLWLIADTQQSYNHAPLICV
jgi:hypothetical protein